MTAPLEIRLPAAPVGYEVPWREGLVIPKMASEDWAALFLAGVSPCFLDMAMVPVFEAF